MPCALALYFPPVFQSKFITQKYISGNYVELTQVGDFYFRYSDFSKKFDILFRPSICDSFCSKFNLKLIQTESGLIFVVLSSSAAFVLK